MAFLLQYIYIYIKVEMLSGIDEFVMQIKRGIKLGGLI